jgi:hypothetical protein
LSTLRPRIRPQVMYGEGIISRWKNCPGKAKRIHFLHVVEIKCEDITHRQDSRLSLSGSVCVSAQEAGGDV